jgi:hypothetical protein
MLGVTLLCGFGAIALARLAARGFRPARIGLVVLAGVSLILSACSVVAPATSLSTEPAAGALLNAWPTIRLLSNFVVASLAVIVMVLVLTADAGPPRRGLPAAGPPRGRACDGRRPTGRLAACRDTASPRTNSSATPWAPAS